MKTLICIFFLLIISSCNTKFVLIDSFQGSIYDKKTNTPIKDVFVKTDSLAINYFTPIKTNLNGFFVTSGMVTTNYDTYYTTIKNISYNLILQSNGYISDTINLKSYNKDNRVLDSINLGKIYLIPKSISNDSLK